MRVKAILSLFCVLCAAAAPAAQLTWDPLQNGSGTAGSGNWDTTSTNTVWFNGTSDVIWSGTGTAGVDGAIFNGPDAAPGTYQVNVDSSEIAITNMQVNNNGYVFSGANGIYVGSSDTLSVAAGKTVTFNCAMNGSGTSPYWVLGNGATMNVGGNLTSGQQVRLAGPSDSAFNLTGTANVPGIMFILAPVTLNGSLIPNSSFYIGYTQTINGNSYGTGSLTINGASTVFTMNGNIFIIGRSGGSGTLNINNGTVTMDVTAASRNLAIDYDGSAGSSATVNVSGGSLTVGTSSGVAAANQIAFFQTGASAASATASLNLTGGTINTWGGIEFGLGGGSGAASLVQSGGVLNVGSGGISEGASYSGPYNIVLSGGSVGALAGTGWSSSLPMTLSTTNGNITFNCSANITLSGALTDNGLGAGLNITNTGTLTLSGANDYSGMTSVSNGTLAIVTGATPTITGPVTLDASAGTPAVTVEVSNPGQYWSSTGPLTFRNGSSGNLTANFQFGVLAPSTSVAPLQVNGDIAFASTPTVNIGGSAITVGTYPLITYTGSVSGTMPTGVTINLSGGAASGYITNIAASKTIALVVSGSTFGPALSWAVGNGIWDINTTANWNLSGNPVKYTDGNAVLFDDTASGPFPVTVTLNTTVDPLDVIFNNMGTTNYTIAGTGNISGTGAVSVLGSGVVTLATTNSYTGGTTVGPSSKLNINTGGNSSATAVGTGTVTLDAGATIDDTSGSDVTLQAPVPFIWNGNFTYMGSANNFNTGTGQVTMNANTTLTVGSNNLTVAGSINDNGNNYKLTKAGGGALTLSTGENYGGGFVLSAGLLNIGNAGALGSGSATFNSGTFDNVTGSGLTLNTSPSFIYTWGGNLTFLGSSDLSLGPAQVNVVNGLGSITLNIVNGNFTTEGDIANANTSVVKTGNGTWAITGASGGAQSLGLFVDAGEVTFAKTGGQTITGGNNVGLTINSGGLVQDENNYQIRSDGPVPIPVNLFGGTWDLFGWNENVDKLAITSGGTLLNTYAGPSIVNLISGYTASLTGTNCQMEIASGGSIDFEGPIGGTGSLVVIGPGALDLASNNVYTGSTSLTNDATLAFQGVGSISNTASIDILDSGSTLDLSGSLISETLTLLSGQALSGFGTVNASLAAQPGSTVAPGSPSTIGTLTITGINGGSTLGGTTMMKLNASNATSDLLSVGGSLTYGGTLALQNLSGTLAVGDTFTLFSAGGYSGAFSSIVPASPGSGLAWDTTQLASGKVGIKVGPILPPGFSLVGLNGSLLSITATNGAAGHQVVVLGTTNLLTPVVDWTPILTNTFNANGDFSNSINMTNAVEFLLLRTQ